MVRLLYLFFTLYALSIPAASPVQAQTLQGQASVIDGDTIEIHGQRIRLHAVDAPESVQHCLSGSNQKWRCGQQAANALADFYKHLGSMPYSNPI